MNRMIHTPRDVPREIEAGKNWRPRDFRIVQLPAKMIISKAFWSRMDHSASCMTTGVRSAAHALVMANSEGRDDTIRLCDERLPYRTASRSIERGMLR